MVSGHFALITANWEAFGSHSSDRWVIPVGAGFGKIVKTGGLPHNINLQGYYNVVSPNQGPDWLSFPGGAAIPEMMKELINCIFKLPAQNRRQTMTNRLHISACRAQAWNAFSLLSPVSAVIIKREAQSVVSVSFIGTEFWALS